MLTLFQYEQKITDACCDKLNDYAIRLPSEDDK